MLLQGKPAVAKFGVSGPRWRRWWWWDIVSNTETTATTRPPDTQPHTTDTFTQGIIYGIALSYTIRVTCSSCCFVCFVHSFIIHWSFLVCHAMKTHYFFQLTPSWIRKHIRSKCWIANLSLTLLYQSIYLANIKTAISVPIHRHVQQQSPGATRISPGRLTLVKPGPGAGQRGSVSATPGSGMSPMQPYGTTAIAPSSSHYPPQGGSAGPPPFHFIPHKPDHHTHPGWLVRQTDSRSFHNTVANENKKLLFMFFLSSK